MSLSGSVTTNKYSGRYYELSWTATQSISDNESTINWQLSAKGADSKWFAERAVEVKIDGNIVFSKTARVQRFAGTVKSGTIKLKHNSQGDKSFAVSVKAAVYTQNINCTGSNKFTLNTIPRKATITSAPDFNDTNKSLIIKYSNLAGNSVDKLEACISLDGNQADIGYREISKTGTSYTFNLTDDDIKLLEVNTKGSNSRTVRFYVRTIIDSDYYYSYLTKTFTVIDCKPTLNATITDILSDSVNLTGDSSVIIKGFNNISINCSATALKEATIVSQKVTCGKKSITSNSDTLEGNFSNVDSADFIFSATDSRGNTTTQTIKNKLIEYIYPTCILDIKAPTADGNLSFNISGYCFNGAFSVSKNNAITVSYRYKTDDTDKYTDWINTEGTSFTDNTYNTNVSLSDLDYKKTYTFQARIVDSITNIDSAERKIKTKPIFDWSSKDFNFEVPVAYKNKKLFYTVDDTITISDASACFSGFISNLQKKIYFTIPLTKPVFDADAVSFSGTVLCRSVNGYINGTTYSSDTAIDIGSNGTGYNITSLLNDNGITVIIDFTSTIENATKNNAPVIVTPYGDLTITFTGGEENDS